MRQRGVEVLRTSSLIRSEPWGGADGGLFTNAVLEIEPWHTPRELLSELLKIEAGLGRRRTRTGEARVCDLDILLWAGQSVTEPDLSVPHPRLAQRRFILVSLCELIPDTIHPLLGRTFKELLAECADPLRVWPFDNHPTSSTE